MARTKKDTPTFDGVWFTIDEVASMMRRSRSSIERAKDDGSLPHYKFGKSVRFHKNDVEAFIAESRRVGR